MSKLPTKDDYIKTINYAEETMQDVWNKELYQCPRCGAGVKRDYSVSYMSNPPKYRYFCKNCNYSEII